MDWRSQLGDKWMSPDEAVSLVQSGDHVGIAPFTTTPFTLCDTLYARRGDLKDVRIDHPAGLFSWMADGGDQAFRVRTNYATPMDREGVNAGAVDYLPIGRWRADEIARGYDKPADAFLVPVSPP